MLNVIVLMVYYAKSVTTICKSHLAISSKGEDNNVFIDTLCSKSPASEVGDTNTLGITLGMK